MAQVAGGARRVGGAWQAEASSGGGIVQKLLVAGKVRGTSTAGAAHAGGHAHGSGERGVDRRQGKMVKV
jgi:hypothetical protein